MLVKSSAPGKTILFGEHFVVYGTPAIACAIQKRSYCQITPAPSPSKFMRLELRNYNETLQLPDVFEPRGEYESFKGLIEFLYRFKGTYNVTFRNLQVILHSDLPPAMGLGSSASILAALAHGLNLYFKLNLSLQDLNDLIFQGEHVYHGTPSGIDNTLCVNGGFILYQGGKMATLDTQYDKQIFVINSGVPRNTRAMVEFVYKFKESNPQKFKQLQGRMEEIVQSAKTALLKQDSTVLGELMNQNHQILCSLGVSHPKLDQIVKICNDYGALGTKITGAGGGGCVICLIEDDRIPALQRGLTEKGIAFFLTNITHTGLQGSANQNGTPE